MDTPQDDFFTHNNDNNNDPLFMSTPMTLWSLPELASVGHTSESARNLGHTLIYSATS